MKLQPLLKERVLYIDSEIVLSYKRGILICRRRKGENSSPETADRCAIGALSNKIPLLERFLRKEPRCAARIDETGFIISFEGKVLYYDMEKNEIAVEHRFDRGMNNPLSFLCESEAGTGKNDVIYGEYIWNTDRGPVSIYKRSGGKWQVVYSFPEKTITHIHNIVNDPYRKGYLVLTGDADAESGIWFADRSFRKVTPVLTGKQQYRSCAAYPTEDGFIYATDTPLEENYVYHVVYDGKSVKKVLTEFAMPGPCIYSTMNGGAIYFSTSVEPDSSLPALRYRMTYKLGRGVHDRYSHIIRRTADGNYEEVLKLKKDILPMWAFQFGNVFFPQNETDELIIVTQSLKAGHGYTFRLEQEK